MTTTATLDTIAADLVCDGHTISAGTLRSSDLAAAILAEFDRIGWGPALQDEPIIHTLQRLAAHSGAIVEDLPAYLQDVAAETIDEAIDILNDHAPDGYYVGTSEGDGALLAWWPILTDEDW
jgi:hypothetical protein